MTLPSGRGNNVGAPDVNAMRSQKMYARPLDRCADLAGVVLLPATFPTQHSPRKVRALGVALHDRMPAILRPDDYERWVFADCETALTALGPYPSQMMQVQQLGPAINSSRNEGADLLIPCA